MTNKTKVFLIYFLTLVGIFFWLGAIFLAPYLKSQSSALNNFIYAMFSAVCHQNPARSFFAFGYPFSVCSRCFGIYFGFLAGTFLFPLLKSFRNVSLPKVNIFFLFSMPILVDAAGNLFSIWVTFGWLRFLFGFIWGFILPFYLITGLIDFFVVKKVP
ncbi:DUF2085 domain-containing protein [Acidobacteriota bacterium]